MEFEKKKYYGCEIFHLLLLILIAFSGMDKKQ